MVYQMAQRDSDYSRVCRIAERGNNTSDPDSRAREEDQFIVCRTADRGNDKERILDLEASSMWEETEPEETVGDDLSGDEEHPTNIDTIYDSQPVYDVYGDEEWYFWFEIARCAHEPLTEDCSEEEKNPTLRESVRCKIFLGFTSNLISFGVRDIIRYLCQYNMVEVIVTTTGGIEEDLIKCLADTYKGEFSLPGAALRSKGLNRIGNLLVPNDNYCKFEDWIIPIFDQMLQEQKTEHVLWTPLKVIAHLGKEINNESSYLYWAYKKKKRQPDVPFDPGGLSTKAKLEDEFFRRGRE